MFLKSADGVRAEDLCVFHAFFPAGRSIDFSEDAGDDSDLLLWLKSGRCVLFYTGSQILSVSRAVCFPKGASYSLRFFEDSEAVLVSFRLLLQDGRLSIPREITLDEAPPEPFGRLAESAAIAGTAGDLRRKEAFYAILAAVLPDLNAALNPKYARIAPGAAALEAQFLENRAVSEYAALCGLRENRFRLLFTEQYGMSPVEYRNALRMDYAHALMEHLHCTVAEAARAAGFANTSYFCRLHRKMFGASPAGSEDAHDALDENL